MCRALSIRLLFGLVAAELVVEADAGDKELVVAAGRRREHVAADRSTGVRHADDAVAEAEVVVLLSMLTHSPSSLTVRLLVQAYSTPAPSTQPMSLLLLLRRSAPLPTVDRPRPPQD